MQFLTKSVSKSIRPLLNSRALQHSWVLSQQCHSSYSTKRSSTTKKSKPVTRNKPSEPPKPTMIPYQPRMSNSIDLVGYVTQTVQCHNHPNGKLWAETVLSASDSRVPIIFEGDIAHTANCHLKKDDQVHITGVFFVDASPSGGKECLQVIVKGFHFIDVSKPSRQVLPNSYKKEANLTNSGTGHWFDLLDQPDEWYDYRECKLNGSVKHGHPDFKKKDDSEALWLNDAPKEILSNLKDMKFDIVDRSQHTQNSQRSNTCKSKDESWKDLVENISEWWDNRLDKKNPKAPDFKHKKTGVALWLDAAPKWVIETLPPPKSKLSDYNL